MFGMTVGALVVYLKPAWFPADGVRRQLAIGSVLFPVLVVASFLTQLSIPFRVHPSIVAIWAIVLTYAVIAAPFVLSGILVALTLTRFPRDVGRLYAFDLVGAALGCVLLVWLLEITDGPTAVLAISALAAIGGVFYALDEGSTRLVRWSALVSVALIVAAAGHTVLVWRGFPVLRILYVKAGFEARPLYERWNSYSRIRVFGNPDADEKPYAWGLSPRFPADRTVKQLHLDIDVAAGTVLTKKPATPAEAEHLEYDVTNIGYYLRPKGHALVVGVGGGRDVLSALHFGATQGHRRRDQHQHPRDAERPLRRLHRAPRSRSARALRQRRGTQLHRPQRRALRRHPDLADRHVGGDRRRRLRAVRELALHRRGVGHLPVAPDAARPAQRVALVVQRPARRGLPHDRARHRGAAAARRRRPARAHGDRAQHPGRRRRQRAGRHRHAARQPVAARRRRSRDAEDAGRSPRLPGRARRDDRDRRDPGPPRVGPRSRRRRRRASDQHRAADRRLAVLLQHAAAPRRAAPRPAEARQVDAQHGSGVRARHAAVHGAAAHRRCASSCRCS